MLPDNGRVGSAGPVRGRPRTGVLAVAGSALALFWPGAFAFGLPGVLSQHWQQTLGMGRGAVGATVFFMLASLGIFMFVVGRLQERLGPRIMVTIGGVLTGASLFILAFATSIHLVYVWGFVSGTASCFVMIPALTVVQRWYPRRRGLVSGIVNLVFGSAGAIMAPLFALTLNALGYRTMTMTTGAIALLSGLAIAQVVRLPSAALSPAPSHAPAGDPPPPGPVLPPSAKPMPTILSLTVGESLRTRNFWLIWLLWALQGAAGIAMVSLSVDFGVFKGFGFQSAVVILTAFNVANGLSRLLTGYFSDRIDRTKTMGATFLAAGIAYFLLPHVGGLTAITLLAACIGTGFGTLFSVSAPLAVDCFGIGHFGAIYGLIFTAYGFVAGALGPLLGGVLVDTAGGYGLVFGYLGVLCVVCAVLVQFVKVPDPVGD